MIRPAKIEDSTEIAFIYNYYIEATYITFEMQLLSGDDIAGRILTCKRNDLPWLVAEEDGKIIGYCYASKWKDRSAYKHSVEATIYLAAECASKGWGSKLYKELLSQLKSLNYHVVVAGIALPNAASVALHEKFGMEKVAHFKEVGRKFGQWIDVGYWQCLLQS